MKELATIYSQKLRTYIDDESLLDSILDIADKYSGEAFCEDDPSGETLEDFAEDIRNEFDKSESKGEDVTDKIINDFFDSIAELKHL